MPYNINILLLLFSAHRLSSAYHPKSNGRAEVSVKSMKRLLRDNVAIKANSTPTQCCEASSSSATRWNLTQASPQLRCYLVFPYRTRSHSNLLNQPSVHPAQLASTGRAIGRNKSLRYVIESKTGQTNG